MNQRSILLAKNALNDMLDIMFKTNKRFGPRTAVRYDRLIEQAIDDLSLDAFRLQTKPMFHIEHGLFFYHMRYSRNNVMPVTERIAKPRHYICFRLPSSMEIQVLRVLHERRRFEKQSFTYHS